MRAVPALYLNIYNLLILSLILSFILPMCFICLNTYLAFTTVKHQGLWPLFHSSFTDTTDLTLICAFFHCVWATTNTQETTLFAPAALQDFHNYITEGHQAFPPELSKVHPCLDSTPAALGTGVTRPRKCIAVTTQGRC